MIYATPLSAEFCHQQIFVQVREAQAAAVRAAISPNDYTLRLEQSSREEVAVWVDLFIEAMARERSAASVATTLLATAKANAAPCGEDVPEAFLPVERTFCERYGE